MAEYHAARPGAGYPAQGPGSACGGGGHQVHESVSEYWLLATAMKDFGLFVMQVSSRQRSNEVGSEIRLPFSVLEQGITECAFPISYKTSRYVTEGNHSRRNASLCLFSDAPHESLYSSPPATRLRSVVVVFSVACPVPYHRNFTYMYRCFSCQKPKPQAGSRESFRSSRSVLSCRR